MEVHREQVSRKTTMGHKLSGLHLPPISRRRFVQGLALTGAVAGLGLGRSSARRQDRAQSPSILRGMDFTLDIGATPVNFTGTPRVATAVNGPHHRCTSSATIAA